MQTSPRPDPTSKAQTKLPFSSADVINTANTEYILTSIIRLASSVYVMHVALVFISVTNRDIANSVTVAQPEVGVTTRFP